MTLSNQKLNNELLRLGAHTSGSYIRRLERLRRFQAYPPKPNMDAELNLRGSFNQSERSAAWALLYLRASKTETLQSARIPVLDGAERIWTLYSMPLGTRNFEPPGVPTEGPRVGTIQEQGGLAEAIELQT
jgi:hypothetical protein